MPLLFFYKLNIRKVQENSTMMTRCFSCTDKCFRENVIEKLFDMKILILRF